MDERQRALKQAHEELRRKIEAGRVRGPTPGTGELDRTRSPEVETAIEEGRSAS